ncbi:MAG: hypothetical protein HY659_07885, partial [Rhizobiales bacterium]|nr:hypothetical protein [Hyphomicrobiales bacterium]
MLSGDYQPDALLRVRRRFRAFNQPSSLPVNGRAFFDPRRIRRALTACPELDCLRDRLPPGVLAAAELRAGEIGTGADRVLICNGVISEQAYINALAAQLGLTLNNLEGLPRSAYPYDDERLITAAAAGLLELELEGSRVLIVAPHGIGARRLVTHLRPGSALADRVVLTTPARLRAFVARHGAAAISHKAAEELKTTHPDFSAGTGRAWTALLVGAAITLMLGATAAPGLLADILDIALAVVFLGWTVLR